MTTNPQRLLAYALIAVGVFLLVLRLGGAVLRVLHGGERQVA